MHALLLAPLFALSLLAAPQGGLTEKDVPDAHPLRLHAALDHAEVTLGQPFALVIEVAHDAADTYALPADLAAQVGKGSLELRGEPQVTRAQIPEGALTTLRVTLADVASMKPTVPELVLDVQGPTGQRRLKVPAQALSVESLVAKEGAPNEEHAHHGPKPPEAVRVRSYLWLVLLAAIAAIAAGTYAWIKLRKRAAEKAEAPPPPEPPESEAIRRLRDLRNRAPWNQGEGRAAIFELSEIVRVYLGKRLEFNAIDLTSDELVRALRGRELSGFDLVPFAERVQWEDLVKFAKLEPTANECVEALDEAGMLVEHARKKLEPVRNADLVAEEAAAAKLVATQTNSPATNPLPAPPTERSAR